MDVQAAVAHRVVKGEDLCFSARFPLPPTAVSTSNTTRSPAAPSQDDAASCGHGGAVARLARVHCAACALDAARAASGGPPPRVRRSPSFAPLRASQLRKLGLQPSSAPDPATPGPPGPIEPAASSASPPGAGEMSGVQIDAHAGGELAAITAVHPPASNGAAHVVERGGLPGVGGAAVSCDLFCVCDGHDGVGAARLVHQHLVDELRGRLAAAMALVEPEAGGAGGKARGGFAAAVRAALAATFDALDALARSAHASAGCACTVALVTGLLLTVASVGDCAAVLDTSGLVHALTVSHRLDDSPSERERVAAAGALVARLDAASLRGPQRPGQAGAGPLRIWPGGLGTARSIGDADAGPLISPRPHVRQALLPPSGARLVIASDGIWDACRQDKVIRIGRGLQPAAAAAAMLAQCVWVKNGTTGVTDDMTCVVVDLAPTASPAPPPHGRLPSVQSSPDLSALAASSDAVQGQTSPSPAAADPATASDVQSDAFEERRKQAQVASCDGQGPQPSALRDDSAAAGIPRKASWSLFGCLSPPRAPVGGAAHPGGGGQAAAVRRGPPQPRGRMKPSRYGSSVHGTKTAAGQEPLVVLADVDTLLDD